ncbi:MAG: LysE family translocator [Chitinophagaceae bacterium]
MFESIIKGIGLGLILALSVGPVIFTIIKQSINNGHKGGMSFVVGVWISDIVLVIVSNFFTELVRNLLSYEKQIAVAGSAFLIGLGIYYIFFKKVNFNAETGIISRSFSGAEITKISLSGFLINTLNPSVIIFWLVNATALSTMHTLAERFVIFSICLGINIIADIFKVFMAGKIRNQLTARHIHLINRISGSILLIFGAALVYGAFTSTLGHH